MENKEDWQKLQQWEKQQKDEQIKKYGIDFNTIDIKDNKKVNFISKGLNFTIKTIKKAGIISLIIFLIVVAFYMYFIFKYVDSKSNFDPEELLSKQYNQELITLLEETDKRGNGKYVFACKDNSEIIFTAFKNNRSLKEDYLDNCQKYYFEKWESNHKQDFIVKEETLDGILEYAMYFDAKCYEDISKGVKEIKEFIDSCNGNYNVAWSVFITINNNRNNMILPFDNIDKLSMNLDDIIKKAEDSYNAIKDIK